MSDFTQDELLAEIKKTVKSTMPAHAKDYIQGAPIHKDAVDRVSNAIFKMLKKLFGEE